MAAGTAPLSGRTIAVTRPADAPPEFDEALVQLGAEVLAAPLVSIVDPPDWGPCDRALDRLDDYSWIVFTSRNAWPRLAARLASRGVDASQFAARAPNVAAIGAGTAGGLRAAGIRVALVAAKARGEGLAAAFTGEKIEGCRVLLPRALEGRDVLPEALRAAGAMVDVVPVYATVPNPEGARLLREALAARRVDAIVLTSGSALRALLSALDAGSGPGADPARRALDGVCLATIGPVTSQAVRDAGLEPTVEAPAASTPGLVSALVGHFDARARARAEGKPAR